MGEYTMLDINKDYFMFNQNKSIRHYFTPFERKLMIDYHPRCSYCLNKNNLVIDHIYPINLGGSNDFFNLTIACISCNSKKKHYPIYYFLLKLIKKREECILNAQLQITYLRCFISSKPKHYQHTYKSLTYKINKLRKTHSYLTRIINSIINKKYQIFK